MALHIQTPVEGVLTKSINSGNGQHNLVLLLVDQISAQQSGLEGVWLLITLPQSSTLTMVPVFPDQMHRAISLSEVFALTEDNQPSSEFLNLLSEQILWDEFLIIDREGISSLLDTFEEDGMDSPNALPKAALIAAPQLTLELQTSLWQSMCDYLSRIDGRNGIAFLFDQVSSNLPAGFSWDELPLYPMGAENTEVKLGCEFPTLNLISP